MIEMITIRGHRLRRPPAGLSRNLITHFLSLGATGYTVTPCRGKGSTRGPDIRWYRPRTSASN